MNIRLALLQTVLMLLPSTVLAATAPPPLPSVPAIVAPVPLQIVVYDQPEYMGRAITIDHAVPDLSALKFDNRVASLVIKGPGDWVLCENRNYTGRCARVQMQAVNLKLFQLNDRVSSLYPVPTPVVPPTTAAPVVTPPAKPNKPQ